jgi:CheY-like chemotaxis protein
VAATAYDGEGIRQAARDVGCSGYIKKPFDYEQLGWILNRVMNGTDPSEFIDGTKS